MEYSRGSLVFSDWSDLGSARIASVYSLDDRGVEKKVTSLKYEEQEEQG